ncbi:MAG: DNA-binding protein [Deltaproteobacteria bacterium]|nr:DNA-binding protein [Deltaproteobacteria bacterium]
MLTEYLTTEEVAQMLKIGATTLEQSRLNGSGPKFIKFGKKTVRYQVSDVVGWGKKFSSTAEY